MRTPPLTCPRSSRSAVPATVPLISVGLPFVGVSGRVRSTLREALVGGQGEELDEVPAAERHRFEQLARLLRPALALEPLVVADLGADLLELFGREVAD